MLGSKALTMEIVNDAFFYLILEGTKTSHMVLLIGFWLRKSAPILLLRTPHRQWLDNLQDQVHLAKTFPALATNYSLSFPLFFSTSCLVWFISTCHFRVDTCLWPQLHTFHPNCILACLWSRHIIQRQGVAPAFGRLLTSQIGSG